MSRCVLYCLHSWLSCEFIDEVPALDGNSIKLGIHSPQLRAPPEEEDRCIVLFKLFDELREVLGETMRNAGLCFNIVVPVTRFNLLPALSGWACEVVAHTSNCDSSVYTVHA